MPGLQGLGGTCSMAELYGVDDSYDRQKQKKDIIKLLAESQVGYKSWICNTIQEDTATILKEIGFKQVKSYAGNTGGCCDDPDCDECEGEDEEGQTVMVFILTKRPTST